MIISIIIVYILFIVYAITQGKTHAILYSRLGADSFPYNEHKIFTVERCAILLIILFSTLITIHDSLILILVNAFGFSFWHNGSYYLTKGKIFKEDLSWFYNSKTSTAFIEINATIRTVGVIISLIIIITWLIVRDAIIKPI